MKNICRFFFWRFVWILRNIRYFFSKYKLLHALKIKGKNVVLFYLPEDEMISGGVLSIYFLLKTTRQLFPDFVVLPVIIGKWQHYFRINWFKNDYFIYNLLELKKCLLDADKILVHVPEDFYVDYSQRILKHSLTGVAKRSRLNILNQNELLMPSSQQVEEYKELYASVSMTLAFEVNLHNQYSYLNHKPYFLSSWFYGNEVEDVEYNEKQDLCIISPDQHPLKGQIVNKLAAELHLKCIEINNMKYDVFKELQCKAKWSVTFGEGFDGYAGGAFVKGGIGFGVYDKNFFPDALKDSLPMTFFNSYEELSDHIVQVMQLLDNPVKYTAYVKEMLPKVLLHNTPEKVRINMMNFYKEELVQR